MDARRRRGAGELESDVSGRSPEATRGYADEGRETAERTREIRQEIDETRGEMSETIDAIQEKLRPGNIVANATDRVKSATTERVREMADTASETAQQAMEYTREGANTVVETARQNPIPLALIGIGAAWFLTNRSRSGSAFGPAGSRREFQREYGREYRRGYSTTRDAVLYEDDNETGFMARIRNNPVPTALAGVGLSWLAFSGGDTSADARRRRFMERQRPAWTTEDESGTAGVAQNLGETASEVASRTKEYASETADSMRRMARRRQNQLQRMVYDNPLLVGAGALMLGAAFGLALPETDAENEWMGETRDNGVGRARDLARDAANQVQEAAGSVADAAGKLAGKTQT